jgi:hypothetical protein
MPGIIPANKKRTTGIENPPPSGVSFPCFSYPGGGVDSFNKISRSGVPLFKDTKGKEEDKRTERHEKKEKRRPGDLRSLPKNAGRALGLGGMIGKETGITGREEKI